MTLDHVPGDVKAAVDIASAGVCLGTIAQLLPHVAAFLTIFWTLIRIYETATVQRLVRRRARAIAPTIDMATEQEKQDG